MGLLSHQDLQAHERDKLERLCRYVSRPPLSTKRLSLTRQGKGKKAQTPEETQDQSPAERRASMTWAKRLKRVFNMPQGTLS